MHRIMKPDVGWWILGPLSRSAEIQRVACGGDRVDEEPGYGTEFHQLEKWVVFTSGVSKGTKPIR